MTTSTSVESVDCATPTSATSTVTMSAENYTITIDDEAQQQQQQQLQQHHHDETLRTPPHIAIAVDGVATANGDATAATAVAVTEALENCENGVSNAQKPVGVENLKPPQDYDELHQQQQQQQQQAYKFDAHATKANATATTTTTDTATTTTATNETSIVVWLIAAFWYGIFLLAAVALSWYYMGWLYGVATGALIIVITLLIWPGWRWFYIAHVTRTRDLTGLFGYLRLLLLVKRCERKNLSIADIFQESVAKHPDKVAIVSESQTWTFRQLHEFSNRVANLFHSHGYKKGDTVGLLLENRAEFVGIWLGLSKLGVITPLINTNLRAASLVHSITVSKCVALIFGEAYCEAMETISGDIPSNITLYQFNNHTQQSVRALANDLTTLLEQMPKDKVHGTPEKPNHHDKLLYIYTSGTTGLPKAAVISHSRYLFIAAGIHYTLGFKDKDVFYTPLPLYHTAGGIMSMGQAIVFGSTVAIRKKFSASGYFPDCVMFNCTVAQYIGEMARYILATPPSAADRVHKVRMIFGNGLRPQIWPHFVERFNIAKVGEFYGATEGNANIINNDNTVGAIGFVSRVLPQIYPISIIRANPFTGEPIRGPNGLCQLCEVNEPGVFIGKIVKGNPTREFLGYVDKEASKKKIVHDVFQKGDMAFLSGDLIAADERGYLYFKDRTGDTFRWKGENVSTSEVEAQVSNVAGYRDAIVYGVTIPNTEGRAGMAAIHDPERKVDLDVFAKNLNKLLPKYAQPIFLRFLTKVDLTGTFKLRKVDLQREGYDPSLINDTMYYLNAAGKYESLDKSVYDKITRGELKF